jgi:hypothetical protein
MAYDWEGKRTRRMNLVQSVAIGAFVVLGCVFLSTATGLLVR